MEEKLQKALVSITLKVGEARKSPFCDRDIISSMTELLRHFKDNGMLKEAIVSGIRDVHIPDRVFTLFSNFMKEDVKFAKPTDEETEAIADKFISAVFD